MGKINTRRPSISRLALADTSRHDGGSRRLITDDDVDSLLWKILFNCPWLTLQTILLKADTPFLSHCQLVTLKHNIDLMIEARHSTCFSEAVDWQVSNHSPDISSSCLYNYFWFQDKNKFNTAVSCDYSVHCLISYHQVVVSTSTRERRHLILGFYKQ